MLDVGCWMLDVGCWMLDESSVLKEKLYDIKGFYYFVLI
jgi:hypothetical protein